MLFGRRKPGYTTTVDGSVDPEQAVLELQKAELAAKKKPKAEVFDIDAASETARRLKETIASDEVEFETEKWEIDAARAIIQTLGGEDPFVMDYLLPETEIYHRVVTVFKSRPTPKAYPRKWSKIKEAKI